MRKRKLREDERELWDQVAKSATPLHRPNPISVENTAAAKPSQPLIQPKTPEAQPIPAFRVGENATGGENGHALAPTLSASLAAAPVEMDKKAFGRLKRGKLRPEARIDLHGMTLAQAHPALTGFVLRAHAEGKRLVLVITGKGKPSNDDGPIPRRRGVLRHEVPHWLRSGPLRNIVLQISESHIRHGGAGAYYVYLRRSR
ncbi:Smr/MutS family protein [Primorskyibacter aestuariivivens]|uniref:Smr/MutS family protein n=1 Tax=Primorskyibacter aestuariivivens TaxID=1888912 RepID=UPI0023018442|nr:Smr/MutS family protein [Primorskyibacter aestuariivivens]MDA7427673.1 Smr/MutS family protein [Primorskyibacter aestuariivivens]